MVIAAVEAREPGRDGWLLFRDDGCLAVAVVPGKKIVKVNVSMIITTIRMPIRAVTVNW